MFSLGTIACGNVKRVDTGEVKAKMEEYKIKKISEATLVEWGNEEGEKLVSFFEKNPNLECQDEYKIEGSKISMIDYDSPAKIAENTVVQQLIEAYKYSYQNKQEAGNNLQKINDSTYVFSFPISAKTMIFNNCKKQLALAFLSKSSLIKSHLSKK
jgi:hypothetical protein